MTTTDVNAAADLDDGTVGAMGALARALHVNQPSLGAMLDAILLAAVEIVTGTDFAGINLLRGVSFEPQAVLGGPPNQLDLLQQSTGTGPCIDASRQQQVIRVDDVAADPRWPQYAELAASLDVRAMLCLPMWVDDSSLGSISFYSRTRSAFGMAQERLANLLAVHSAVALAEARQIENLTLALHNRDLIGQAKGIMMERHRITAEAAFRLLSEASQRSNRKLSAIAEQVATTGVLPD